MKADFEVKRNQKFKFLVLLQPSQNESMRSLSMMNAQGSNPSEKQPISINKQGDHLTQATFSLKLGVTYWFSVDKVKNVLRVQGVIGDDDCEFQS